MYLLIARKISFCGLNCENCGLREGVISENINTLIESLKETALYESLIHYSDIVTVFKYEKIFYLFLEELRENFGSCKGCTTTSGFPFCKVRKCAIEKGINSCSNCEDFSNCDLVKNKSWL